MKEKFSVTGMTCSACSAGIERTVKKLNGVNFVSVSLMGESMSVDYDETLVSRDNIIQTVKGLGYDAFLYDESALTKKKPQPNTLKMRFFLSLFFLVPLMYFSMGGMIGLPQPTKLVNVTLQAITSLCVIIINYRFFTVGFRALVKRNPNMDTLVAMGSGISFIYSFVAMIMLYCGAISAHFHFYYESAGMILALVTLGKWLEEKSKRKTGDEIEKLIKLMPNTVTVERRGVNEKIAFSDIVVGDILIVKQGEYIPVDGKIIEGHAFIDRSAVTGESLPIEVTEKDAVTSADIVKSGFIKVKAEKVGVETTLSQIVKMVKEAGASKAPLQKIADKISGIFVPVVALIALTTFFVWFFVTKDIAKASNYAISVLVISCPCSLGLATPVAVMASTGRGMALGILYKDAESLQKAREINCVLLDKTATLTVGEPKVTDFTAYAEERFVLELALAVETRSNHPIAECIKRFAVEKINQTTLELDDFIYENGKGATAKVEGKTYFLGNRKLLSQALQNKATSLEETYATKGKTVVFLADENALLAVFALADVLKEESKDAVALLQNKNIRVAMLTGDNEKVAKAIAGEAGVKEYFAEALPKDKIDAVKRVKAVGGIVAMVGDGVNDSPALKEADIGIAMGNGTDIAIDSADIVLARGDLRLVEKAITLSKLTVRNIHQNLFWAFFYNCIAIPVACGAFAFIGLSLNPMIGAGAMSLSSLFVVSNALRLTRFDKKKKEINSMQKTLKIDGMMCQHCVNHVTKALSCVEGVVSVDVNLKKKIAVVTLEKDVLNDDLSAVVVEAGYTVKKIS